MSFRCFQEGSCDFADFSSAFGNGNGAAAAASADLFSSLPANAANAAPAAAAVPTGLDLFGGGGGGGGSNIDLLGGISMPPPGAAPSSSTSGGHRSFIIFQIKVQDQRWRARSLWGNLAKL